MLIDTEALVAMTEANQNFSRVVKIVEEQGAPCYTVIDFAEYRDFQEYRRELIEKTAEGLIEGNLAAFRELAK